MGTLLPNTFQHPNDYIDWLSYYLTPEEEKVLNKAVREILGWYDKITSRQAHISLSVFVEGKHNANGKPLCRGCGLSTQAVRKALQSLDDFAILVKRGDPTNDGQLFYLQEDWDAIEWNELEARRAGWDAANSARTQNAREAREEGVMCDNMGGGNVAHKEGGNVGQQQRSPVLNSVETQEPGVPFLGLGKAERKQQTIPDHYVEIQIPDATRSFRCPECGTEHGWPPQVSKRHRYNALTCNSCGAYFSVEIEETGDVYKLTIPEQEWVLYLENPMGPWTQLPMTASELQTFRQNWAEDSRLVMEKIMWAAVQDWLAHQRDKVIARVNSAFETAKKAHIEEGEQHDHRVHGTAGEDDAGERLSAAVAAAIAAGCRGGGGTL